MEHVKSYKFKGQIGKFPKGFKQKILESLGAILQF